MLLQNPSDVGHGKQGSDSAGALPKKAVLFCVSMMSVWDHLKGASGFMTWESISLRYHPSFSSLNCTIRHFPTGRHRETFVCLFGGHSASS